MPLDLFRQHALTGPIELYFARALEDIEHGLAVLAKMKENPDNADDLSLPNYDVKVTLEAEKNLLKYKRGIEKMMSEKLRKELGLSIQTN